MPKKRATKATKTKPQDRVIPITWSYPEDMVSSYATNMLVQNGDQELYVSFFEVPPPVLFNPEDAQKLESVNAECIARIIITPDRMAKFIEVLQQQLDTFKKKKKTADQSNAT